MRKEYVSNLAVEGIEQNALRRRSAVGDSWGGGGDRNKSETEKLRRLQLCNCKLTGELACAANGAKSSQDLAGTPSLG